MKSCINRKGLRFGLDLTTLLKIISFFNIIRAVFLAGPMHNIFRATEHLKPGYPTIKPGHTASQYVLYPGHRYNLTTIEQSMLQYVEGSCGTIYRNHLPAAWGSAAPLLGRIKVLMSCSIYFPVVPAVGFLIFQKKEKIAFVLTVLHFFCMGISIYVGILGAWFLSDRRFCFLTSYTKSYSVPSLVWIAVITSSIVYKIAFIFYVDMYVRYYYKHRINRLPPSPYQELRLYLKELRKAGVKPKAHVDRLSDNLDKLDWKTVDAQIKKALVQIRAQVAELNRNDPTVDQLIQSGKLRPKASRLLKSAELESMKSIMKAGKMMENREEYTLLKKYSKTKDELKDDVEVILPQSDTREFSDVD